MPPAPRGAYPPTYTHTHAHGTWLRADARSHAPVMAHSCIANFSIRPPLTYRTSTSLQVIGHEGSCFPCCCVQNRSSLIAAPIHSRSQLSKTCKVQTSCSSLRLGAAEEGVSSWEEKLESTSSATDFNEGNKGEFKQAKESDVSAWRDRIVDEEGNIDNVEQEYMRDGVSSPCEGSSTPTGLEESEDIGGSADHSIGSGKPEKAKESDVSAWRDRIVDEEGNIDNIEQEYVRDGVSPCEGSLVPMASEESEDTGGSADHSIGSGKRKEAKESDVSAWRDRIVDDEENIDNIEQEYMCNGVSPCEESSAHMALQELGKMDGSTDHIIVSGDTVARHHHRSHLPENLSGICDANFQNFSSTTDAPRSWEGPRTRTMDWRLMAETNRNVSSPTSEDWPGENNIREGDMGEANVGDVNVLPSSQQEGVPPPQFQEREKYGWSEVFCDEGSLSRKNLQEHNGGSEAVQEKKVEDSEEMVFLEDTGRTPDDYHRRADLFGKNAEQFVARKHMQEERESVQ